MQCLLLMAEIEMPAFHCEDKGAEVEKPAHVRIQLRLHDGSLAEIVRLDTEPLGHIFQVLVRQDVHHIGEGSDEVLRVELVVLVDAQLLEVREDRCGGAVFVDEAFHLQVLEQAGEEPRWSQRVVEVLKTDIAGLQEPVAADLKLVQITDHHGEGCVFGNEVQHQTRIHGRPSRSGVDECFHRLARHAQRHLHAIGFDTQGPRGQRPRHARPLVLQQRQEVFEAAVKLELAVRRQLPQRGGDVVLGGQTGECVLQVGQRFLETIDVGPDEDDDMPALHGQAHLVPVWAEQLAIFLLHLGR